MTAIAVNKLQYLALLICIYILEATSNLTFRVFWKDWNFKSGIDHSSHQKKGSNVSSRKYSDSGDVSSSDCCNAKQTEYKTWMEFEEKKKKQTPNTSVPVTTFYQHCDFSLRYTNLQF